MQILPIAFIVGEDKGPVLFDRSAGGYAELIPLKARDRTHIEKVPSVERIIPQEFKCRTGPLIGAGLGDDRRLSAGMFPVLRGVCIPEDVEFTNGVHTKLLLARPAGLHVVLGSTGI